MKTIQTIQIKQAEQHMDRIQVAAKKAKEGLMELRVAIAEAGLEESAPQMTRDLLTKRQRQVFELIAAEKSVEEIAKRLKMSPRTVESHRDHIRFSLNLRTLAELNEYAKNFGKRTGNP